MEVGSKALGTVNHLADLCMLHRWDPMENLFHENLWRSVWLHVRVCMRVCVCVCVCVYFEREDLNTGSHVSIH